jgi:predicted ferric reductase
MHEFWYLSRGAGVTAYLLLTVSVLLGLLMHTRLDGRLAPRAGTFELHRFVSLLALAMTALHTYILLGDDYFGFTVAELSIPFALPYRPVETAIGVLAAYSLIVVVSSFFVRQWIGYRAWRALHYLTFALYVGAAVHGILAGSDTAQPWARAMYLGSAAVVFTLIAYRVQARLPANPLGMAARLAAAGALAVAAFAIAFTAVAT